MRHGSVAKKGDLKRHKDIKNINFNIFIGVLTFNSVGHRINKRYHRLEVIQLSLNDLLPCHSVFFGTCFLTSKLL